MAETLANILSGVPADPTQVNPGLGPLLTQALLSQQLGGQSLAQGAGIPPGMAGQIPGMISGANTPIPQGQPGFGSMGSAALPLIAGAGNY